MAASNAELEMRVRALETRSTRHEDDLSAIQQTVTDTYAMVKYLVRQGGGDPAQVIAEATSEENLDD